MLGAQPSFLTPVLFCLDRHVSAHVLGSPERIAQFPLYRPRNRDGESNVPGNDRTKSAARGGFPPRSPPDQDGTVWARGNSAAGLVPSQAVTGLH